MIYNVFMDKYNCMKIRISFFFLLIIMFQVNSFLVIGSSQNEHFTQKIEFDKLYPDPETLLSTNIHFFGEVLFKDFEKQDFERKNANIIDNQKLAQESYTIGDKREFWARDADSESDNFNELSYKTSATLVAISDHALIYAESPTKFSGTDNLGNLLAIVFEDIYDREVPFFGIPSDIDNNDKIIILLINIGGNTGIAGYYLPLNLVPISSNPNNAGYYSNYADMIYINDRADKFFNATIAHEFQHLIQFGEDFLEDIWLNEALSTYSELYTGYTNTIDPLINNEAGFGKDTSLTSLNYWKGTLRDYGSGYLFLLYLADRFGESIISQISNDDDRQGLDSINDAIQSIDSTINIEEIFQDWAIALAINDKNQIRYSFSDRVNTVKIPNSLALQNGIGFLKGQQVSHWSSDYIELKNQETGTYWVSLKIENSLWEDEPREISYFYMHQDQETAVWQVINLSVSQPHLLSLNDTGLSYFAIISTTGKGSEYTPSEDSPSALKTAYNIFVQKAYTVDLPNIILDSNDQSPSLLFKVTVPLIDNTTFWLNPASSDLTISFEVIKASDGQILLTSTQFNWNATEQFIYFEFDTSNLDAEDIFVIAKLRSEILGQEIHLFSSSIRLTPNENPSNIIDLMLFYLPFILIIVTFGGMIVLFLSRSRKSNKYSDNIEYYQREYQARLMEDRINKNFGENQGSSISTTFCTNCGNSLSLGENYCMECGQHVEL